MPTSKNQQPTMSPTMHALLIAAVLALGWCCASNNGVMAMSYPRRASLSDPASAWLAAADTNLPSTAGAAAPPATPPVPQQQQQQQQSLRLTLFEDFTGSTLNTTRWNVRNNESHCCPAEPELYLADEVNTPASSMQSYHVPVVHTLVCRPSGVPRRWLPGATNKTAQRDRATWGSLQVHKWMGGHQGEVVSGTVVRPKTLTWCNVSQHCHTRSSTCFQRYGRFEVHAALPARNETGTWPAHWLMPNPSTASPPNVCWPVGGEIDIMEVCWSLH